MHNTLSTLFIVSTLAAMVPLLMTTFTSYIKISVVLSVMRGAFGGTQIPSPAIVGILSLLISMLVMAPTFDKMQQEVTQERLAKITSRSLREVQQEMSSIVAPWMSFLEKNQSGAERRMLRALIDSSREHPTRYQEQLMLVTGFVLSELKRGFLSGVLLLIPFLIIDIVCAQIITALGLTLLTPTIVSLPLKLLLFVQVDGWLLVARSFIAGYSV